jgi:methylase of polypeptide subunit release factors
MRLARDSRIGSQLQTAFGAGQANREKYLRIVEELLDPVSERRFIAVEVARNSSQ